MTAAARCTAGVARRVTPLAGDRTVAWAQTGEGHDLVAIHGTLTTLDDMWLGPAPALARRFRVTALDRPGHGLSRRLRYVDASIWRQAQLIREALEAIGIDRPILLGHSFGGAVALAYALQFPENTAGVVAVAPLCQPEPRLEQVLFGLRALPALGPTIAGLAEWWSDPLMLTALRRAIFLPQAMPDRFAQCFPAGLTETVSAMVCEGEDALSAVPALIRMVMAYPACRVPVRFLAGTADIVVNNAFQAQVAAALLPDASLTWIDGLGHMLHHFATDAVVEAAAGLADATLSAA